MSEPIIEGEIWKAIPGFEGKYSVSNLGRVKSHLQCRCAGDRILKPNPTGKSGYLKVNFMSQGGRRESVARLVAHAFLPADASRPDVNHIDGNVRNNRVDNLEWVTKSENMLHSRHVLRNPPPPMHRGVKQHLAKLNDNLVVKYRALHAQGTSIHEVARISGLDRRTIQSMLRRKTWAHVV